MAAAVWSAETIAEGDDTLASWSAAFAAADDWLAPVGEVMREDVEQRFQQQRDPWGAAWAPHSPVTIKIRIREGKPGRILIKDRYLANSFHASIDRAAKTVTLASGGPAAAYAAAQQFGNPSNRMFGKHPAPLPARAMLPLRPGGQLDMPPRLADEIRQTILDAFDAALARFRGAAEE